MVNKSIDYIGTEEPAFVSMIYKKVANRESPQEIIKKVEKILDEDAEVIYFCIKKQKYRKIRIL